MEQNEKVYLMVWWDGKSNVDVYQLGKKGINALKEGQLVFEDYMDERFGRCVGNNATWMISYEKPTLRHKRVLI